MRDNYHLPLGEVIVSIDPGMAFGTGDHPTTRLCARRLLDFRDRRSGKIDRRRVVDVGCGSGILAISAARLGFTNVFGFDLDREAVRISRENLRINGLEGLVHFRTGDLPESLPERSTDLLLSNISAEVFYENAEILTRALRKGGTLAASGILAEEIEEVVGCLTTAAETVGRKFSWESRLDGGWADICLFEG
jgi:ribosomal protein L11 methyltransferase